MLEEFNVIFNVLLCSRRDTTVVNIRLVRTSDISTS